MVNVLHFIGTINSSEHSESESLDRFIHPQVAAVMQGAAQASWEQFRVPCLAIGHSNGVGLSGI